MYRVAPFFDSHCMSKHWRFLLKIDHWAHLLTVYLLAVKRLLLRLLLFYLYFVYDIIIIIIMNLDNS